MKRGEPRQQQRQSHFETPRAWGEGKDRVPIASADHCLSTGTPSTNASSPLSFAKQSKTSQRVKTPCYIHLASRYFATAFD